MEPMEKKEPMEAIEQADPIEPIERIEPLEPIERNESSDHNDHREGAPVPFFIGPSCRALGRVRCPGSCVTGIGKTACHGIRAATRTTSFGEAGTGIAGPAAGSRAQ